MIAHRMQYILLAHFALAVVIGCHWHDARANATTAPATTQYTSDVGASTVAVSGTSTLHDWSAIGGTINGIVECSAGATGVPPALRLIKLSIPVNSLKSSEGAGMDKTMDGALKMSSYPLITYDLTNAEPISPPSRNDPEYRYKAAGQLTIAGTTRTINLALGLEPAGKDALTVETQATLKMSDFGIKPPTAMLGMIQSGDAVTVTVTWKLTSQTP